MLTDLAVRKAVAREKPYKLSDGGGLYLLVTKAGQRCWRVDYRFGEKRSTAALGVTQPETSAIKAWLDALPDGVRPVLMIDFHSTGRNLFYVQGDEASPAQQRFLSAWLGGREDAFASYPFTIEPRNANPGSGTAKNWFHASYAIPAYTYEVADTADRAAARNAATELAVSLLAAMASG